MQWRFLLKDVSSDLTASFSSRQFIFLRTLIFCFVFFVAFCVCVCSSVVCSALCLLLSAASPILNPEVDSRRRLRKVMRLPKMFSMTHPVVAYVFRFLLCLFNFAFARICFCCLCVCVCFCFVMCLAFQLHLWSSLGCCLLVRIPNPYSGNSAAAPPGQVLPFCLFFVPGKFLVPWFFNKRRS